MATSIQVDKFATPHGKGEGGGGGTTIVMGGKNNSVPANLNVNTINATTGNIQNLTGRSMTFNDASFIYLVSENGTIAKLNGNDLKYENGSIKSITSDSIDTGKLKTTDLEATNATIDNIISKNITTEYLTVTKQAHFFELVIDKIKSVGGQIILTPASCIADYVITGPEGTIGYDENEDPITGPLYYDVYFRATDEVNREITNDWRVDDQAICQNFNNAAVGHSYNVSNKYYWRLVTGILDDVYINFRTGKTLPYDTSEAHDYTSANIWNICLGANDVNTGNHIDYKTEFGSEPGGDPYYPADPDTEGYTKRSLLDNVDIVPMKLNGLPMAGWTDKTEPEDEDEVPMVGEMKTYNTIFGIQITPKEGYQLDGALLNNIELSTAEATRLNIGVYYVDGSSQYFPAPLEGTRHYDYELNANTNVEAIIITNSDEPDWHLCHGIQLGNDNSDPDDPQVDVNYNPYSATVPSIPEAGDNIIQLGYRYHKYSQGDAEYDVKRASAIIIASYHTPDTGINPPSYAQYKKITDFNLTSHRHTYFDADGSKFYGNFYVGPDDSDPEDYVPISDLEAEVYKIVPNYDIITKDVDNKIIPPTLTCSFMVPNQSELVNVVPTGCVFNYWKDNNDPVSISAGNTVSITLWDQNNPSINLQNKLILQLAKLIGDSGQQGPQGSQGVQTQKILDQILKQVVEIDVANGEPGLNGGFTEWVYRNGVNGNNLPTDAVPFTELDNGWSKTATTPQDGQFTWCTTRDNIYVMSNNVQSLQYGNWKPAYRITGNNGKNGEDGDPGTAGKDGKYIEYIYKHFTTEQTFGDNNYNPAYWDPIDDPDYYAYGWDDHPQGLGTIDNVFYEFEYMSQREFDGEHFGKFTTPVIWSRWGQNGRDGDGYEYIYTLLDTEPTGRTHPNNISYGEVGPQGVANGRVTNKNQDEWVPNGWTDEPQGVSSTTGETKEWVSMRKRTDGDWGIFSDPALWAQYVPKGTNGGRYYFLYANYGSTGTRPGVIPTGSSRHTVSDLTNNGWSLYSTTPDYANNKYTYMTQAFFNDGDSDAVWSAPARITGDNGQKGEDGSFTEFIYTRNSTGVAPSAPTGTYPRDWPNNGSTDHQTVSGVTWYDNPQGVTENVMYEYVSSREYNGVTGNWTPYSTPVIWSKWGEKGEDGDGYEYVFLLWFSSTAPTIYSNDTYNGKTKTNDGYLPYSLDPSSNRSRWSDNPVSPTSSTRYVYVSMRKKTSEGWGDFSAAKLWTKYVTDGATGPTGPQGSQGSSGQNGTNGTNGISPIEYKLVDLGSIANVQMSLDENTNEINQKMTVKLTFRVLRCEGSTSRYMYGNEFNNMRVYYRMSQQSAGTSYYYRLLTLNSTSSSTIAQFTVNYETTYDRIVQDNPNIIVSLVNSTTSTISDAQITSYTVYDTTNISTTLESGAAINVVQSDVNNVASIKSLVTGPQGISTIWQTMNGIQSEVKNVRSATNLIMNGAFMFDQNFWSMWGSPSAYNIISDADGYRWGHVRSNAKWQGYYQKHNEDYNIAIEGGKIYTLSYRAYCKQSNGGQLQVCFHWGNNTDLYKQFRENYSSKGIPQINLYSNITDEPETYSHTFVVKQNDYDGTTNYSDIIFVWNGTSWVPTGKPVEWFEFMIGPSKNVSNDFYITDIMLTPGSEERSWSPCAAEITEPVGTLISQTANDITMRVNDVSTRLDNGGFTINANTRINGQLTVNSNNDGIKVVATTYNQGNSVTTAGYVTGGPIDSFSSWNNKECNESNAISRLGANGYEYISPWSNNGAKIYMGAEGTRFDSLNTAIQLSEYHLNKYVKDANFTYSTGYKHKPIDYKGIRIFYVKSDGIYLNNQYGTRLAYSAREYTLSPYDEMIIIHGDNSCILTLPSPTFDWTGKTITIRNNSKKAIRLDSSMGFYSTYWSSNGSSYDNDSHDDYEYCNHLYVRAFGCTQLVYNYTYSNAMTGWHEITNGFSNTNRSDAARTATQMDNGNGW